MKACVVIPTLNPGTIFERVLAGVLSQHTGFDYELVVVDSGSTDGTLERIEQSRQMLGDGTHAFAPHLKQITLHQIKKSEFGHGRTRNLGASLSDSELIAFLTHDALPASSDWLANLVAPFDAHRRVAGAFGRHLPYPGCRPTTGRGLRNFMASFDARDHIVGLDDTERYEQDAQYRQFLHFYSDNNSCMRRSIWNNIPYPDVRFGEDQAWAKMIIEAGYRKAYVPDAPVFHSHDYGFREAIARARDEWRAYRELFGYRDVSRLIDIPKFTLSFSRHDLRWLRRVEHGHSPARALDVYAQYLARFWGSYLGCRGSGLSK